MSTPFATTMDYSEVPAYAARAELISRSEANLRAELRSMINVIRAASGARAMILDSNSGRTHPDLLATIFQRLRPRSRRPVIIFIGDMWQKDPGLRGEIQKWMLRLADPAIAAYVPLSTGEIPIFAQQWKISAEKLHFCPYFYTFAAKDIEQPAPPVEDYVFAGGNTHRDYAPLLEAAEMLPEIRFEIASTRTPERPVPSNVNMRGVSHVEFVRLMRAARLVVVPMRRNLNRSSGHQTYLNAMLLGKLVIVTDILGVRDHVEDGQTALVVEGTAESYRDAILRALDPAKQAEMQAIVQRGQVAVRERFNIEQHALCVMRALDEAIAARG